MPIEITMPQLSDTMAEGTLVKWRVKEGDAVKEGQIIAEVETDKANMEMEAFDSGTLALCVAQEGQKVQVGALMAVLVKPGEKIEEVKARFANGKTGSVSGASSNDAEIGRGQIEAGRARSRQESVQDVPEHTSEAISREAAALVSKPGAGATGRVKASPLAKRVAASMGVDLAAVQGTGPGGRVVQRDIESAGQKPVEATKLAGAATPAMSRVEAIPASQPAKTAALPIAFAPRMASGASQIVPISKIRAVIAQRLQQAKQTIPHFYETIDIDVEQLTQIRVRLNTILEKEGIRLSLADLIAKGLAAALGAHPELNATFDGQAITRHADVNLGIAVALKDGLIVPVLRNINQMGLKEIRIRSADLIERARQQKLKQEELSGGTFTISNLGAYGVREFSAIINPPEVAVLAIASAEKRPVVKDDQVVARTMLTVTLSADHRAVDGATAADFLRTLKALLEEPGMMLV